MADEATHAPRGAQRAGTVFSAQPGRAWYLFVDDGAGQRPATHSEVIEFSNLMTAEWHAPTGRGFVAQPPDIGADVPGGGAV
jgi:hypothetical protein